VEANEREDAMKRETKLAAVAIVWVGLLVITLVTYLVARVRTPSIWFGLFLNAFFFLYVYLLVMRRKEWFRGPNEK
jgi:hypothetical protein